MVSVEDDILDALDGLSYPGAIHSRDELDKALSGGLQSTDFTNLVSWLSQELHTICGLDEQVHPVDDVAHTDSFMVELSSFLKELDCPYSALTSGPLNDRLSAAGNRRLLLSYLLSELQAARMCAVQQLQMPSTASRASTALKKPSNPYAETAELLKETLKSLEFSKAHENITSAQLIEQLSKKVKENLSRLPKDQRVKPLFDGSLNKEQWTALQRLNGELLAEYDVRAQLLLKRLDVTIQSFAWSDRIKQMEAEMFEVYRPLRDKLHSNSSVSISGLLAARNDLSLVVKMSDESVRTLSKINKVMLQGKVPDRGGRPADIQAPLAAMPAWQKERASAPAGRGGGRGRGSGGGSGRVQRGGGGGGGGRGHHHGGGQRNHQGGGDGGYGQHHQAQYQYDQGGGYGRQNSNEQAASYGGYAGQQEFYGQDSGHGGGGGGGHRGRGHFNKRGRQY